MRNQTFEGDGKITPRMGKALSSVAEYFDVSILGSLNCLCVEVKSTRPTNSVHVAPASLMG